MKRYRYRRMTIALCALICVMFAYQIVVGIRLEEALSRILFAPDDDILMRCGAAVTGMPLHAQWRLITSMFVHGGLIHLAANLIALWQLGALLEELFGAPALILSFAIGGIVAGGVSVAGPGSAPGMLYVGASGAIFAIAGALLVGLRSVSKREGGQWSQGISARLLGCLGFNLVLGLVVSAIAAWADLGFAIAVTAHVVGLVAGLLVGLVTPMTLRDTPLTRRLMSVEPPPTHGGL
jgi:rhomboid protease GluP